MNKPTKGDFCFLKLLASWRLCNCCLPVLCLIGIPANESEGHIGLVAVRLSPARISLHLFCTLSPHHGCYLGVSMAGSWSDEPTLGGLADLPNHDLLTRSLCLSSLAGSQTCFCLTAAPSGPRRRAGWCSTSRPPATTGWSTHGTTWACSSRWRLWMVSPRQHPSSCRCGPQPWTRGGSRQSTCSSPSGPGFPCPLPHQYLLSSFLIHSESSPYVFCIR